jgi:hypothetical protein
VNHHFARAAMITTALAALGIAGCGGSNKDATATATATQAQSTATATATQTATQTTTTRTSDQKVAIVPGKQETLQTGDIGLSVKVDKVVDPVDAQVDRAQPGNKLVGVFVTGQTKGTIEPTRTTSGTTLQTSDGRVTGIRVIADGDCAGGFSANELLLATKKPVTGCIGFEIPKKATPESITILLIGPKGTQKATWKLPKAK